VSCNLDPRFMNGEQIEPNTAMDARLQELLQVHQQAGSITGPNANRVTLRQGAGVDGLSLAINLGGDGTISAAAQAQGQVQALDDKMATMGAARGLKVTKVQMTPEMLERALGNKGEGFSATFGPKTNGNGQGIGTVDQREIASLMDAKAAAIASGA